MITEVVSPDREVMIALGPGIPGVRSNVKKTSARDAIATAGIQVLFKDNADLIFSHGAESSFRILSTTRSSREMDRDFS